MDDLLVEINAEKMKLTRTFLITAGREHGYDGLPPDAGNGRHADRAMNMPMPLQPASQHGHSRAWMERGFFVACNRSE